jgi:hypothetical protein
MRARVRHVEHRLRWAMLVKRICRRRHGRNWSMRGHQQVMPK